MSTDRRVEPPSRLGRMGTSSPSREAVLGTSLGREVCDGSWIFHSFGSLVAQRRNGKAAIKLYVYYIYRNGVNVFFSGGCRRIENKCGIFVTLVALC